MNEKRGNWYLLTGLVLGLVIGLGFAWFISPVKYTDIAPASLTSSYKDEYRRVIALAYTANHDIDRARVRINLLDANNPAQVLAAQAQHMVAENQAPQEARALALLAADLGRPQSISAATPAPQTTSETTTQAAPGEENTAVPEETDLPTVEVEAAIQTPHPSAAYSDAHHHTDTRSNLYAPPHGHAHAGSGCALHAKNQKRNL